MRGALPVAVVTIAGTVVGVLLDRALEDAAYRLDDETDRPVPRGGWLVVPAVALVWGLLTWRFGVTPALVPLLLLGVVGVALTRIDLDVHRLPEGLTLPAVVAVLALQAVASALTGDWGALLRAVIGGVLSWVAYLVLVLLSRGALGWGDATLGGLVGLTLGYVEPTWPLLAMRRGLCPRRAGLRGRAAGPPAHPQQPHRVRPVHPARCAWRWRCSPRGPGCRLEHRIPDQPPDPVVDLESRGGAVTRVVAMLRWLTAGESHGPALVAVLEGLPAGVVVTSLDVAAALARRRLGYGRGARMRFEQDQVEFLGGLRHGRTLGSPVAIRIGNTEWPKWATVMSPDPVDPLEYAAADDVNAEREIARNRPLTRPRPGHADLVGMQKYGFEDARPVLERASARETAARVALGEVAARLLEQAYGIRLVSHTVAIGRACASAAARLPTPDDVEALDADPVRTLDLAASAAMVAEIDDAHKEGDTLGGVVEVLAYGVPPGLGSHAHWDRRLDARLAAGLMSIHAIKGVEVGECKRARGAMPLGGIAVNGTKLDPRIFS